MGVTRLACSYRPRKRTGRRNAAAVDLVTRDIGGVVTRVGDETIGEMWSLWDGADILNEIDSRFAGEH